MSENMQTPYFKKLDNDIGDRLVNEVLVSLDFAVNPQIDELRVLPWKFMTIPGLQRFIYNRDKFEKYIGDGFVMFRDSEFLIRYFDEAVELIIASRSSRKLYRRYIYRSYELPAVLTPRYKDLTEKNSTFIPLYYTEDIAREFFALQIELDNKNVLYQGHLYAIPILRIKNVETWINKDHIIKIANHYLRSKHASRLTNEIYYLHSEEDVVIESDDHGVALLPRGEWVLYHPFEVD